jgi:hypothetical protein
VPDPSRDMPRGCDNTAAKMRARGAQAGAGRTANADTTSTYISNSLSILGGAGELFGGFDLTDSPHFLIIRGDISRSCQSFHFLGKIYMGESRVY